MPKRVLLIEDDGLVSEPLQTLLDKRGCTATVVTGVRDALKALQDDWDVIVLDLGLPDGRGEEILLRLKTRGPEARVIVLTGEEDPLRLDSIEALEPFFLIQKPIAFPELADAIAAANA